MSRRKPKRKFTRDQETSHDPASSAGNPGQPAAKKQTAASSAAAKIRAAQTDDGSWQLVHPRCALRRQEDIEEVEQMIEAGETEIAQDELRWLLSECHDFLAAHKLLGDLAVTDGDFRLARGHYGYAYQIGIKAIESAGEVKSVPFRHVANQAFFEAGKGLVICLHKLGKAKLARDVTARLLQLDSADPLRLCELSTRPPKC